MSSALVITEDIVTVAFWASSFAPEVTIQGQDVVGILFTGKRGSGYPNNAFPNVLFPAFVRP